MCNLTSNCPLSLLLLAASPQIHVWKEDPRLPDSPAKRELREERLLFQPVLRLSTHNEDHSLRAGSKEAHRLPDLIGEERKAALANQNAR